MRTSPNPPPVRALPYRSCDRVEQGCKAPPALAESYTKGTCYACGLPVCTNPACSRRIMWAGRGRKRVCSGCGGHDFSQHGLSPEVSHGEDRKG